MIDLSGIDLTTEVVRTERLVLRPFTEDDVEAVFDGCQDPDVQRWINIPVPYTREDARAYVTELCPAEQLAGTGTNLAVEVDGRVVGSIGVHRIGQHPLGPEIGYWMAPAARGRGIAAEATHALAEWALGLGAHRVYLVADVGNTGSQAVARRAGFTEEGVVRAFLGYRDGSRGDAVLFARLPGD